MGTLINVVLDKSGSMSVAWDATISGFNEFLATQQLEAPDSKISLLLFNTHYEQRYTNKSVKDAELLNHTTYVPGGNTALYDAIGRSIKEVEGISPQPDKVVFVILTDGQENSSVEYTQQQIFDLISWHANEGKGWEFTFLGANQDAYAAGRGLGIPMASTMNYNQTKRGTHAVFLAAASATADYAKGNTNTVSYDNQTRSQVESTK